MPDLTQAEIDERAGILRRFREALVRQRERFSRYLQMLETQSADGSADASDWKNPEEIEIHVAMEQEIVREISSFQQVIEPLEAMYREKDPAGAAELPQLRSALERTREEVVKRTAHNRDMLRQQVEALRNEISSLKLMRRQKSLYATPEPRRIDISA